jgi:hypothetical protein
VDKWMLFGASAIAGFGALWVLENVLGVNISHHALPPNNVLPGNARTPPGQHCDTFVSKTKFGNSSQKICCPLNKVAFDSVSHSNTCCNNVSNTGGINTCLDAPFADPNVFGGNTTAPPRPLNSTVDTSLGIGNGVKF